MRAAHWYLQILDHSGEVKCNFLRGAASRSGIFFDQWRGCRSPLIRKYPGGSGAEAARGAAPP